MKIRKALPKNIVWESLATAHAHLAVGNSRVKRYPRGYPPVVGFVDPDAPDFDALSEHCDLGEVLMGEVATFSVCEKFQLVEDTFADLMVLPDGRFNVAASRDISLPPRLQCARLGSKDAGDVQALVTKTNPGPFSPRALELGTFYGVRDHHRLVAVAGIRFDLAHFQEIATVCTDVGYEGQGLARHLVGLLICDIMQAGKTPFLHVLDQHERASRLYDRMGFIRIRRLPVKAFKRVA